MIIETGKKKTAIKTVIYGPEGVGKSTLASQFPEPLFIDLEEGTRQIDTNRFGTTATSWRELLDQITYVIDHPNICKTLVIDTADTAENLCIQHLCYERHASSIEEVGGGYGKGYTILGETFGNEFLTLLNQVIKRGINVVIISHSTVVKFEEPLELNTYDRYKLKLAKKIEPLVKEWCDLLLFIKHKTIFEKVGNEMKATNSERKIYTQRSPAWDAKSRFELDPELPLDFKSIAHLFDHSGSPCDLDESGDFSLLEEDPKEEEIPDFIQLGSNETTSKIRDLLSEANITEKKLVDVLMTSGINPEVRKPKNQVTLDDYSEKELKNKVLNSWENLKVFILGGD